MDSIPILFDPNAGLTVAHDPLAQPAHEVNTPTVIAADGVSLWEPLRCRLVTLNAAGQLATVAPDALGRVMEPMRLNITMLPGGD